MMPVSLAKIAATLIVLFGVSLTLKAQGVKPPVVKKTPVEEAKELFQSGKYKDAFEALEKASKADPELQLPRVLMATWFYEAKRGSDARLSLERAAIDDPAHPDVYLTNASFAYGEGRLIDAILNARTSLSLADNTRWNTKQRERFIRESHLALLACFEARNDFDSAKEHALAILNNDAKNGAVRLRLARIVFNQNKPEEAFQEFTRAFNDDKNLPPPELSMAQMWQSKNDIKNTEDWMKKAIQKNPDNARSHRAYASWLLDHNQPDAARPYLDAARKIEKDSVDNEFLLGVYFRFKKQYPQAVKIFDQLYRDSPSNLYALRNLALSLVESEEEKDRKRGVELAESLVRQNNQNADFYAVLGWCLFKVNRVDDADKALGIAIKANISPDTAYFVSSLFAHRMIYDKAKELLEQALKSTDPFVYKADAITLLENVSKKIPDKEKKK